MIKIGSIVSNRVILAMTHKFVLAQCIEESPEPFTVWRLYDDMSGVHSGSYFKDKMDAEWEFCSLAFPWFQDNVNIQDDEETAPEGQAQGQLSLGWELTIKSAFETILSRILVSESFKLSKMEKIELVENLLDMDELIQKPWGKIFYAVLKDFRFKQYNFIDLNGSQGISQAMEQINQAKNSCERKVSTEGKGQEQSAEIKYINPLKFEKFIERMYAHFQHRLCKNAKLPKIKDEPISILIEKYLDE
ncbi:MAG TPA: hypothetical protein PKI60_00525 [Oscillospiraceae bacterium]|nr:hypothetical protein [Oscillospiraceae bacterium]